MTTLRELTVRNVAGRVSNCSALATADTLERIAFFRCYDLDAAGFPTHTAFPRLSWISFDDLSAADAKSLRTRIEGFWNGHVRHPRSRAWLKANDDNPFRTWTDDAPELGHPASTHWRRAKTRLLRATTTPERESAVRHLAEALDRLAGEWPLDTLRREQAGEAVRELAGQHLPPAHPLTRWEPT